jgi:hypothetical protein
VKSIGKDIGKGKINFRVKSKFKFKDKGKGKFPLSTLGNHRGGVEI